MTTHTFFQRWHTNASEKDHLFNYQILIKSCDMFCDLTLFVNLKLQCQRATFCRHSTLISLWSTFYVLTFIKTFILSHIHTLLICINIHEIFTYSFQCRGNKKSVNKNGHNSVLWGTVTCHAPKGRPNTEIWSLWLVFNEPVFLATHRLLESLQESGNTVANW